MAYKSQKYSKVISYNEGLNISSEYFEGMFGKKSKKMLLRGAKRRSNPNRSYKLKGTK